MKLYAGTTERFRADTQMHRIAEKLRAEYVAQIGHKPGPSEVASWQNSLMALSMLLDHCVARQNAAQSRGTAALRSRSASAPHPSNGLPQNARSRRVVTMTSPTVLRERSIVGQVLREHRVRACVSRAALAAALGRPSSWVAKAEEGEAPRDLAELRREGTPWCCIKSSHSHSLRGPGGRSAAALCLNRFARKTSFPSQSPGSLAKLGTSL